MTEERFGQDRLRSGHLYQIFTYLKNAAGEHGAKGLSCEGMLLCPVVGSALRCDCELSGTRLQVRGADLDHEWPRIHEDLLQIAGVA